MILTHEEPIAAEDGQTHIRISPKGKTRLGRLLTNRAHTPFHCVGRGTSLEYASLEAFWLCARSDDHENAVLRAVHGLAADKMAMRVPRKARPGNVFRTEVIQAMRCKIAQSPELRELLSQNTLPLIRYELTEGDYPTTIVMHDAPWFFESLDEVCRDL